MVEFKMDVSLKINPKELNLKTIYAVIILSHLFIG